MGFLGVLLALIFGIYFIISTEDEDSIIMQKIKKIKEKSNNKFKQEKEYNNELESQDEESIFKYIDLTIDLILYDLNYPKPNKYDCGNDVGKLINKVVEEKRSGNYSKANIMYENILENYGPSGVLYFSWAKSLMCEGHFINATFLMKLANEVFYNEYGYYDENLEFHIDMLNNRLKVNFYEFHNYMKAISGNLNYKFPLHADVVINFIRLGKNKI